MGVRLSRRSACCRRGFLYVDPGRHVPRPARCPDRGGRDPETASPEPARTPGGRTYLQLTGIDPPYAGRLYDVFPGGCVTYGFDFPRGPHVALMTQLRSAIDFVPGWQLRHLVEQRLGVPLDPP